MRLPNPALHWLLLLLLLLALPLAAASGEREPEAVTEANLASLERFWPYRVALRDEWQPGARAQPLRAGATGVLIRVDATGLARIDFSSDGKHDVPIAKTDLVESANRIRRGELVKDAPNFIHAIATRLVDPSGERLIALAPEASADRRGFLCVFADPSAEQFEALAAALAPLRDRHGVMTILFPQRAHSDAGTRERLRALGWPVPFVYDFLSEPYTNTLLDAGTPLPALLLQTNEGRLVFQREWTPEVVPALTAALDQTFAAR